MTQSALFAAGVASSTPVAPPFIPKELGHAPCGTASGIASDKAIYHQTIYWLGGLGGSGASMFFGGTGNEGGR